jgi:hypothetical protein
MRLVAFLQYAALVIGSVGMLAGQFFGLAKGFNLGVFVVGAGLAIGGIDSLVTRRMIFRPFRRGLRELRRHARGDRRPDGARGRRGDDRRGLPPRQRAVDIHRALPRAPSRAASRRGRVGARSAAAC